MKKEISEEIENEIGKKFYEFSEHFINSSNSITEGF
jgi:hypothetical protein